jgi:CRISPR-associated endoribonuclease Cas6
MTALIKQEEQSTAFPPISRTHLFAIMLKLRAGAAGEVLPHAGQLAHAAVLHWLAEVQPELAESLHAPNGDRPFTCSSLWFPSEREVVQAQQAHRRLRISPDLTYWLRLTVLDDQVFRAFARRFLPGQVTEVGEPLGLPQLRLGSVQFDVLELRTVAEATQRNTISWSGYTSYRALVEEARAVPATTPMVGLEFRSPTAFSDGQQAWGKRMHLFPDADRVFLRLAKVWNAWAPAEYALDVAALRTYLDACVVPSQFSLETRVIHFDRHAQVGFVGKCQYELFPSQTTQGIGADLLPAQAVWLLAHFAFYAGVGQKTTMGMGQARPLWQPAVQAPAAVEPESTDAK